VLLKFGRRVTIMEREREEPVSQAYTQYDGDNDAIMRQTHTEREAEPGAGSKTAGPSLEWHFSQVFGERTPGEEVLDGTLRANILHYIHVMGEGVRLCLLLSCS